MAPIIDPIEPTPPAIDADDDIDAPTDQPEDAGLSAEDIAAAIVPTVQPRVQLGGGNSLLSDRDTGVTIRRPGADTAEAETEAAAPDTTTNAL